MKKTISELLKEFDKDFVKDNGPNVEPSFSDPNGQVGPVRQLIKQSFKAGQEQTKQEMKKKIEKLIPWSWNEELVISREEVLTILEDKDE